ncbi:MAG: class I SAM-dependent methyltransferase [Phycisphaerales bacterium]
MLAARLANRMRHLDKWGRRQGISCFRLYERDIPDQPIVIDWFADEDAASPSDAGHAVAWFHGRTRDETPDEDAAWRAAATQEILDGLDLSADRLFVKQRGRQRTGDGQRKQYERLEAEGRTKVVREHDVRFEINLSDYLDVGLFLDHRPTRLSVQQRCRGKRVLNLFAYTGAFSVHARAGGAAATTTVDLSRTYLDWYARNLDLNGWALDADHVSIAADCLQWLEHAGDDPAHAGAYDIVICDPPTFSNSKRMAADSFAIDRDHPELIRQVARLVAPGGEIFFSTNLRSFDLDEAALPSGYGVKEISRRSVPEDFRNRRIHRCWRFAEGWQERRPPRERTAE